MTTVKVTKTEQSDWDELVAHGPTKAVGKWFVDTVHEVEFLLARFKRGEKGESKAQINIARKADAEKESEKSKPRSDERSLSQAMAQKIGH